MNIDIERDHTEDMDLEEYLDPFGDRPTDFLMAELMTHYMGTRRMDLDIDSDSDTDTPRVELLPTVLVKIQAGAKTDTVRGMLNLKASNFNVITEKCRRRFNLPFVEGKTCEEKELRRIGSGILGTTVLTFSPYYDENNTITMKALVVRTINKAIPSNKRYSPLIKRLMPDMLLADPDFDEPGELFFVAGTTQTITLLKEGRKLVGETSLMMLESKLGWVYMGTYQPEILETLAELQADEQNREGRRGNNQQQREPNQE